MDGNRYLVLGTSEPDGRARVSPVYYTHDRYVNIYWVSSPAAQHSRNVATRPNVAIVIFDSSVAPSETQAVYLQAIAAEVQEADLAEQCAAAFRRIGSGARAFTPDELSGAAPLRLYRAASRRSPFTSGAATRSMAGASIRGCLSPGLRRPHDPRIPATRGATMGKVLYSMNVSLDGYIEDANGSIDFSAPGEDVHRTANEQARQSAAFLFGRRLYEVMEEPWTTAARRDDLPEVEAEFARLYVQKPRIVFSDTLESVPEGVRLVRSKDAVAEVTRLKRETDGELDLGGPALASSLVDLIDEFRLVCHAGRGGRRQALLPAREGTQATARSSTACSSLAPYTSGTSEPPDPPQRLCGGTGSGPGGLVHGGSALQEALDRREVLVVGATHGLLP